ncbi:UDP-N-acetylmuramoylalanyl-D-glutamyl-2,6-diaminopimelate/D-alanyl-D-alanyl ligase [Gemmatirosa kalamazoonensis]|uniref:UDP-N-acetylmuramoyl-tripeptide--D-alanyl-D-alanine ligase n=1 Tax=Gemmatirosa kalamazoonensis TaxID=861299 RepID=W0RHL2_9BACT|nr:UDP-N-acetylmuramoyl-tripeptide--D-alanyl-D-alanine ligase [Gemmatirosa kalamazoonensis]AHG90609.1 UDP-N-acetylmuramoylalanyl-D-glutamyl-2,6-diaminopimelate/D-alanyl-D-alanyl ligase [Gemmatirosa kalamazoonensis]
MSTPTPAPGATDFWTLDRVAAALHDVLRGAVPRGDEPLRAVSTDTRAVTSGDLFVALVGDRFDAHDFLPNAVEKGAAALVVSDARRTAGLGVPVYEVGDTLVALGRLGRYWRRAWGGTVVGVAGSNGKTSTKELLKAALGAARRVSATSGNLNNLVGVPLTLLAIPPETEIAIVEMGTNMPGEIARLRAIAEPSVTVMTSIGEEHLEGLGDLAGVLREESDAFDDVELAVVPADQPEVAEAAAGRARRVVRAGLDDGDLKTERWSIGGDGAGTLLVDGVEVRPAVRGVHNLRNTMLALAVARALGVSLDDAARGVAGMPQPSMRSAWSQLGGVTLINDAYNANPGSTRAALDLLVHAGSGRQRVAVLGTMRELGAHGDRLHEEIARRALDAGIEVVAGVGDFADALERVASRDARVVTAREVEALWPLLEPRVSSDAVILLKASRGVALERIVPSLERWAGGEPASQQV